MAHSSAVHIRGRIVAARGHETEIFMPNIPLTWLDQQTANTTTAGTQSDPDIIQLANGNILVCWTTNDNTGAGSPPGLDVLGQIFDPLGNKIGGETRLNRSYTADGEQDMDIAPLPGGGFIAVYEDNDAGVVSIRLDEFDAAGNLVTSNPDVVIDAAGDPGYRNPVIAVSSATSALIVYEETTAGAPDIVGRFYNPQTNTYGAQFDLITGSAAVSAAPDVVALGNGNYAIAQRWRDGVGDDAIAYKVITPAGAVIHGSDFVIGTDVGTDDDSDASLTALAGGGFVIAWTSQDGVDTDLFFRIYDNAGNQTGSGAVNNLGAADNNNEPDVVALADGGFAVVYDDDASGNGKAAHFSTLGAPLGTFAFAGPVTELSAIGLADGRFATVWEDGGDIHLEFLDTRDLPNSPGVYTPVKWGVGTVNDDTILGSAADDVLAGHTGTDTAGIGYNLADDFSVSGPQNALKIEGGQGMDELRDMEIVLLNDGTAFTFAEFFASQNVVGSKQADALQGRAGADTLIGKKGADTLNGSAGNDLLDGGKGNDTLFGGGNDDQLVGGKGNDTLNGGLGNDTLLGGKGADILNGGAGADFMDGGKKSDTFVYAAITDSGVAAGTRDTINLFEANGKDLINVSAIDAIAGGADDAFAFIGAAAFSAAGQIRTTQAGNSVLIEFETTGDNVADMAIDLTLKKGTFDAGDFVL
jgi:Ca2+-binding RTX toxin-like protein